MTVQHTIPFYQGKRLERDATIFGVLGLEKRRVSVRFLACGRVRFRSYTVRKVTLRRDLPLLHSTDFELLSHQVKIHEKDLVPWQKTAVVDIKLTPL